MAEDDVEIAYMDGAENHEDAVIIEFEDPDGEIYAKVGMTPEQWDEWNSRAEAKGMTWDELMNHAIREELKREGVLDSE